MATAESGISTPVGTVLAYAGRLNAGQLNELGWAICDGASLPNNQHLELFEAIGTANGAADAEHFNLPQLEGFFLRGLDPAGDVDGDVAKRVAAAPGGSAGANVGSIQGYATALAHNPFQASVRSESGTHNSYKGTNADMIESGSAQSFPSNKGGDAETRPLNAYVNFVIKTVASAPLLPGMVVAFAGNQVTDALKDSYLICNGAAFGRSDFTQLYDALGPAHGSDGDKVNLPDYRGRFLRGASNGTGHDPDAATRTAMAPGGAVGDAVGSVQGGATALPVNPFQLTIKLGDTEWTSTHCAGHDLAAWNSGTETVSLTSTGGDKETRPVNVNVDHYVLCTQEQGTDIFPIGALIAFPGSQAAPPPNQWMACNGFQLSRTNPEVAQLFAAIGYTNGGDGADLFNLPDYRGYFLRGTDRSSGRDPDVAGRVAALPGGQTGDNVGSKQGWSTASPTKNLTADVAHLPTDDADNAAGWGQREVPSWDDPSNVTITGGDDETRPLNASVVFFIKYAQANA
ncbi:MAG: tail fiber protein [Nocardioidaceae bacterium]|nr:tail fiber protein [Nocardioidaceae bacterium]